MGYTWLGMRKLTGEEVLQRHEKGELADVSDCTTTTARL